MYSQNSCGTNEIFLPSVDKLTNIIHYCPKDNCELACPKGKLCVKTCPGCFCHNGYFRDVNTGKCVESCNNTMNNLLNRAAIN